MRHCAPDLPFMETVLWYLKQFGAVMVILLILSLLYGLFVLWMNYVPKKRRSKK